MTTDTLVHGVSRDLVTRARRSAVRTLTLVGLLVAAGSLVVALTDTAVDEDLGRPVVIVALLAWMIVAYLTGGVVALRRAPDRPIGVLMIAAGLACAASALAWSTAAVPFTIGQAVDKLPQALFLHVFLSYPSGRLTSWVERCIVGTAYAAAVVLEPVRMVIGDYGPRNLLGVLPEPGIYEGARRLQLVLLSVVCLGGAALLARRRRRRRGPTWRWLAVLSGGFVLALLMIALLDQLLAWGGLRALAVRELRWATFWTLGMLPAVLVAGLLEARLARSAVSDVLATLWDGSSPAALRDALAGLLHDPGLRLLYWLPVRQRWSTADGEPEDLPVAGGARVATVIDQDGRPLAALVHDESLTDEPELLEAVAAATGMALENGRLRAELLARVQELTESRLRVLEASRRERQRLERDLHDGAQQRLVTLSLGLGLLQAQLTDGSHARRSVERVRGEISLALEELRTVARGIYPAVLSAHGLQVALESLAATASVPVRLRVGLGEERLPEAVEMAVYFLARESIADVARRAEVTDVALDVEARDGLVVVEIEDDGAVPPTDPTDPTDPADRDDGPARRALADRIEALGGRLRLGITPDGGTAVHAEIPAGSAR